MDRSTYTEERKAIMIRTGRGWIAYDALGLFECGCFEHARAFKDLDDARLALACLPDSIADAYIVKVTEVVVKMEPV